MRNLISTILAVFFCTIAVAQLDSIQKLDEVYIVDAKLKSFTEGYKPQVLNDSLIKSNTYSFTDLLRYNSQIYLRENGYGGVSSASLRGTNASQVAVIWNGIAINSPLNGQTDFNAITTFSSSEVTIIPGGGSSQFGSGAVGGSIHLTNEIAFKEAQKTITTLGIGSFETYLGNVSYKKSTKRYFLKIAADYIDSENNYPFVGTDLNNQNGEFAHTNVALDLGYKWDKHTVSFHSNYYEGDRAFAGTLNTVNQDAYKNLNLRNLFSYAYKNGKWTTTSKLAHLLEEYRYFPNRTTTNDISEGESHQFIVDQQATYSFSNKFLLGVIANYTRIEAEGTNFGAPSRNTLAGVLFLKHSPVDWYTYNVHVRQETGNDFDNPFLVSVDGAITLSKTAGIYFNGSKNYRVPTFNDLFWEGAGNNNLQPETSYQCELGFKYVKKHFKLNLATFYIDTQDLIKWLPNANGIWSPINIQETKHYGIEASGSYSYAIGEHHFILTGNYGYTKAVDTQKEAQLIYVPFHNATGLLGYQYKNLSMSLQSLLTGKVFTTSDNNNSIDGYTVTNIGAEYNLIQTKIPATIGFKIHNVFNTYYENVAFRPLPGINYKLTINFKF